MTPERLDQIRTIYRVSRLAAPDAAVTKALDELIVMAESAIGLQQRIYQQAQMVAQQRQALGQQGMTMGGLGPQFGGGPTSQMMAQQQALNQYQSQLLDQQRGQGQPATRQLSKAMRKTSI